MDRPLGFIAATLTIPIVIAACGEAGSSLSTQPPRQPSSPEPTVTVSAPAPSPAPTSAASLDPVVSDRRSFTESVCPTLLTILELDPRVAELRTAGQADDDVSSLGPEIESVAGELRMVVSRLRAAPRWAPGELLRQELIAALSEIRWALVLVAQQIDHDDASDHLAQLPFIGRPDLDRGMAQAAVAGLNCSAFE